MIMTILCTNISDRVGTSGGPMMNLPSVQHQGARVPWRPIIKNESGLYHLVTLRSKGGVTQYFRFDIM